MVHIPGRARVTMAHDRQVQYREVDGARASPICFLGRGGLCSVREDMLRWEVNTV